MRRVTVWVASLFVGLLFVPSPAAAQEPRPGVVMGYPSSIGVVFHVTERIAVRPDLTFQRSTSELDTPIGTSTADAWSLGIGVSGLFYVREWDKLRTYISPQYRYNRGESHSEFSTLSDASESTTTGHSIAGSFGAQYALHDRFTIFGEVGLAYRSRKSTSTESDLDESTGNSFGTRTAVGVIFYF